MRESDHQSGRSLNRSWRQTRVRLRPSVPPRSQHTLKAGRAMTFTGSAPRAGRAALSCVSSSALCTAAFSLSRMGFVHSKQLDLTRRFAAVNANDDVGVHQQAQMRGWIGHGVANSGCRHRCREWRAYRDLA